MDKIEQIFDFPIVGSKSNVKWLTLAALKEIYPNAKNETKKEAQEK